MNNWHKSTAINRSIQLKDPILLDKPPATTSAEKRGILIRNLFMNHTEAGDTPIDIPTVPRNSFWFPQNIQRRAPRCNTAGRKHSSKGR